MPDAKQRDWTFLSASHQTRVRLAPHVRRVRPGTPLRPSGNDDWEISPMGEDARWLSSANETGGNEVDVWRAGTLATYTSDLYKAGDTLRIDYIDDDGRIYLILDESGKIDAVDRDKIYFSVPLK